MGKTLEGFNFVSLQGISPGASLLRILFRGEVHMCNPYAYHPTPQAIEFSEKDPKFDTHCFIPTYNRLSCTNLETKNWLFFLASDTER